MVEDTVSKTRLKLDFFWWGVFDNWDDSCGDIEDTLHENFDDVETWVVGMILLFRAKTPKGMDVDACFIKSTNIANLPSSDELLVQEISHWW